jgi:putative GTP pyrophosphokinase
VTVGDVYDLAPGLPATTELGCCDINFTRFALPYQIAIAMLTTKIRTLKQEFSHGDGDCPIKTVSARIKSHDRIVAKAQRLCCPLTADDIRANIPDIAGVRITCSCVSDTYRIASRLSELSDVTLIEVEDYNAKPKPNGYTSLHTVIEIPVRLSDRMQQVPVEVQIRAIAHNLWTSCEHTIPHTYPRAIPGQPLDSLTQIADAASPLDTRLHPVRNPATMFRAASSSDDPHQNSPPSIVLDERRLHAGRLR